MWDNAESELRQILIDEGIEFYEAVGEAAFYGPKLDVQIKTAIGHDITLSTCQLDFLLPQRFELEYVGEDNQKHRPVVLHRAILGTSERFISFLLEETKGALPFWLSPLQVKIIPVADRHIEYAEKIKNVLVDKDLRAEVDDRNEKLGYKIRSAQTQKVPFMLVVGDKEIEEEKISVRNRTEGDLGAMSIDEFIKKCEE